VRRRDEAFQAILDADPLYLFELYPMIQARYVADLGEEILAVLDECIGQEVIPGTKLNVVHSKFWFWTLGAYELIRTLSQHKDCFSLERQRKIAEIKRLIGPVRIAFAKHEIPNARRAGKNVDFMDRTPFFSISHINKETRDLAFEIGGEYIGMRNMITSFLEFKGSLRVEDVVAGMYWDGPPDQTTDPT